ncbi:hypothetical protein EVAR_9323_1 [Eumeta japonica]|uniref:Uncharacterized protein n=1 Tax=Eumeta variegata TaxID=151549 RepID=A0A4C1TNV0_EUMVA|nr:hypothetical protein EVAR_9323_1 [Eumeta japonica]
MDLCGTSPLTEKGEKKTMLCRHCYANEHTDADGVLRAAFGERSFHRESQTYQLLHDVVRFGFHDKTQSLCLLNCAINAPLSGARYVTFSETIALIAGVAPPPIDTIPHTALGPVVFCSDYVTLLQRNT